MAYIRKKIIKNNEYYYKQETYREGNKVKTRHIEYLGKYCIGSNVCTPNIKLGTTNNYNSKDSLIQRAINSFKTTDNIYEGGYILDNGKMLDFSGRRNATGYKNSKPIGKDYLANDRATDHREILDIINVKKLSNKEQTDIKENNYNTIKIFGEKTNSIRLTAIKGSELNIEVFKKPSNNQLKTIKKAYDINNKKVIIADINYKKQNKKEYNNFNEFARDL